MAARICFIQLEQFIVENAMAVTAVTLIGLSLAISHRVHMITGR
jgi:hypothetical protein